MCIRDSPYNSSCVVAIADSSTIIATNTGSVLIYMKVRVFQTNILDYTTPAQFSNDTNTFCTAVVKVQSGNCVSLSVKCTFVSSVISCNRRPFSPSIFTCSVIICKVALVHYNVCGEGSIQISVSIVYLLCEPVEVSGVCNLVCTVVVCLRLFIRRSAALVSTKAVDVIVTVLCTCR